MQTLLKTDKNDVMRLDWYRSLAAYEQPNTLKAAGQVADSFLPYIGLWAVIAWMIQRGISYWFVLPLVVLAAGFLVRIFIIFHDCCHGSFFHSRLANRLTGYAAGVLTLTPFEDWRRAHA